MLYRHVELGSEPPFAEDLHAEHALEVAVHELTRDELRANDRLSTYLAP